MKRSDYRELHCAICGKNEKKIELYKARLKSSNITAATFSARRSPDKLHYRFVVCQECGLIFSDPILNKNKIIQLYKNSDFNYLVESTFVKKTYVFYLSKFLPKNRNKLRLLDIGCGNGFFLEEVEKLGIKNVFGLEPGKPSVDKASVRIKKKITVDILRPHVFKTNSFDIITCFQTLDHIVEPNAFLIEIYNVLKTGGKALFIQHNTDGLSVKLFGENSPIFDIEHIYLFNKATLCKIFEKNNFRVVEVFDVKNTYPFYYWIRMINLPDKYKKLILTILMKTKLDSLPLSLYAGNIGIVVEKV